MSVVPNRNFGCLEKFQIWTQPPPTIDWLQYNSTEREHHKKQKKEKKRRSEEERRGGGVCGGAPNQNIISVGCVGVWVLSTNQEKKKRKTNFVF